MSDITHLYQSGKGNANKIVHSMSLFHNFFPASAYHEVGILIFNFYIFFLLD